MAGQGAAHYVGRMTPAPFLVGRLLLAMPGMRDPRFDRTAIAMCVHDPEGALGLVVNRVHEGLTVRDLMQQLDIDPGVTPEDAQVFAGGPVEPSRGFVLHTLDYNGGGTLQVADAWGLTATLDILRDIAAGKGPDKWLMALGYTGWGGGQLDAELTHHGWLPAAGDRAILFDLPVDQRWPHAYAALGVDPARLSPTAGHA
jgi:putative transcriptional regulator